MTEDYCKLASGIILSTIWREDDHTRLLWVTMLAVKGRDHIVRASVPGLAAVANIPLRSCRAGLVKLMAPDPDSRTKDHEGRRISEVPDGWLVLNGQKYRNFLSKAERNEYQARLMAERRAEAKLAPVSKKLAPLAQTETETEAFAPHTHGAAVGSREIPDWPAVANNAETIGLPEWRAKMWFDEMESCGWIDAKSRPVRKWKSMLNTVKTWWEADGRPTGPPKNSHAKHTTSSRNANTCNEGAASQYANVGKQGTFTGSR